MKRIALGLAALAAATATPAFAAQIYNAPFQLAGNQDWPGTLGLNFTVNSAINVTSIGVFDSGSNGLGATLFATIFDSAGNSLLNPVSFAAGSASGASYVFSSIPTLTLGPGTYQIGAWGYGSGSEPNYNRGFFDNSGAGSAVTFNSLGGRLTAVSSSYSGSPGVFGDIPDNGATRYGAGSFIATAVPEPATWALMILGIGMAGAALRRRRKVTVTYA